MRQTMEVGELFSIVAKRKWTIIVFATLFMILGIAYSIFLTTPIYRADTTLIVSGDKESNKDLDIGTISVNQMMAVTYGEIVKSRAVLETVIDELRLDIDYEEFLHNISSEPVGDTEILRIYVEDEDRGQAITIANKITEVFRKEARRVLKVNNIEIIDRAASSEDTVNRSPVINVALITMAGIVIGVLAALIVDYKDDTIKTEEDVEKYLGLSVIGTVPDFKTIEKD